MNNNTTFTSYFGGLSSTVHFSYKIVNMQGQHLEWDKELTVAE